MSQHGGTTLRNLRISKRDAFYLPTLLIKRSGGLYRTPRHPGLRIQGLGFREIEVMNAKGL